MEQRKRGNYYFLLQPLNHHVIKNIIFLLVERGSSLERMIQKIFQIGLAPPQRPTREQIRITRRYKIVTCITYIILLQTNKKIYLIVITHICAAVFISMSISIPLYLYLIMKIHLFSSSTPLTTGSWEFFPPRLIWP
jgi:hypothetical protein